MKTLGVDPYTPRVAVGVSRPSAYVGDTWSCRLRAYRCCHGVTYPLRVAVGVSRPSAYVEATPRAAIGV
jgi:hypothetical protein